VCKCSRVFLPKNHPCKRVASAFNGKIERRLEIMTPTNWIRTCDTEKEKEMENLFDSNGELMFDDLEYFDTCVKKIPIRMKRKYVFYELPYWEHLKVGHLLDPMHIFKNVSYSLWRHISSNKSDTLVVRRYFIASNTKKRHWTRKETRGEASPSWYFKEGDVPWILKKDDLSMVNDVILGVKAPFLYGSTLRRCFTVEGNLSWLKSYDHLNHLRVCMSNT
jgi:hypothetical protein